MALPTSRKWGFPVYLPYNQEGGRKINLTAEK